MSTENTLDPLNSLPIDLQKVKKWVYDKLDLVFSVPKLHPESVEYGACTFQLNGKTIQHRVSKITPTKTGQFVTIWRRNEEGITQPFDSADDLDFIIITSRRESNLGQFIFPKAILIEQGIITYKGKEGKRGIRVYPPWDIPTSKQAQKTQDWQTKYFLIIHENHSSKDMETIKNLFTP